MVTEAMFLRAKIRKKDGKHHRYFSVVENRRVGQNKTAQRTVLYLGRSMITRKRYGARRWRYSTSISSSTPRCACFPTIGRSRRRRATVSQSN